MQKYNKIILIIFLSFSIFSYSFAKEQEPYIENLLDINYGVEQKKLDFQKIDNIRFYNKTLKTKFESFKKVDAVLKKEFMRLYRNGTISYYPMSGIVENYNLFVYHTNKVFYYESIKEITSKYKEIDDAIIKHLSRSRMYYAKVKTLINKELNRGERLLDVYKK